MNFLVVDSLVKKIKDVVAVNAISFNQPCLQKLAIVGATGSGKTTLLKMIGGLVQCTTGAMSFVDKKIIGPEEQLIPGNKGIAYVSQHFELLNNYVVKDLLQMTSQFSLQQEMQVFEICRIDQLLHRRTNELSGGEKQRVALAKQILTAPKLLLLDEPFSNLDAIHKKIIKQVIQDLIRLFNLTCIIVSHDALDILQWAERVIVLQNGNIIQDDEIKTVYQQPVNEYAAALLGNYFVLNTSGNYFITVELPRVENLILRPEQVKVSIEPTAFTCEVKSIDYYGSNFLVKARLENQTILFLQSYDCNLKIGDNVFVSFTKF